MGACIKSSGRVEKNSISPFPLSEQKQTTFGCSTEGRSACLIWQIFAPDRLPGVTRLSKNDQIFHNFILKTSLVALAVSGGV